MNAKTGNSAAGFPGRAMAWGVLPLMALLFLQWPLRDALGAGSRQANDLAQILFALYMAVAVSAATRTGVHLSAHGAQDGQGGRSRWRVVLLAACCLPWAVFVLWASAAPIWQSIRQLEKFPETLFAGYFIVKSALWLMAVLIAADTVRQLAMAFRKPGP